MSALGPRRARYGWPRLHERGDHPDQWPGGGSAGRPDDTGGDRPDASAAASVPRAPPLNGSRASRTRDRGRCRHGLRCKERSLRDLPRREAGGRELGDPSLGRGQARRCGRPAADAGELLPGALGPDRRPQAVERRERLPQRLVRQALLLPPAVEAAVREQGAPPLEAASASPSCSRRAARSWLRAPSRSPRAAARSADDRAADREHPRRRGDPGRLVEAPDDPRRPVDVAERRARPPPGRRRA